MSAFCGPNAALPVPSQTYDRHNSYAWNYDNAPAYPHDFTSMGTANSCTLGGTRVSSRISIAAGPLLNGRWVLHYGAIGYDILTYKTVRRRPWPSYEPPNLLPIEATKLMAPHGRVSVAQQMKGSWAVSFGMPSKHPDVWRADIEETRRRLPCDKRLSVSVVATPEPESTLEAIADDYAQCAAWAMDSGADMIELNFSCPNVTTCDGQLFQDPEQSAFVLQRVRERVRRLPLLVKIGHVADCDVARSIVEHCVYADAIVMINCIPATVRCGDKLHFDGQSRGIAGQAIHEAVLSQISLFRQVVQSTGSRLDLVAAGGIGTLHDVEQCLNAGASGVQVATAIMASGA